MVQFSHPEMFYLLIPFVLVIIWYAISGQKLRHKMESEVAPKWYLTYKTNRRIIPVNQKPQECRA